MKPIYTTLGGSSEQIRLARWADLAMVAFCALFDSELNRQPSYHKLSSLTTRLKRSCIKIKGQ